MLKGISHTANHRSNLHPSNEAWSERSVKIEEASLNPAFVTHSRFLQSLLLIVAKAIFSQCRFKLKAQWNFLLKLPKTLIYKLRREFWILSFLLISHFIFLCPDIIQELRHL